MKGQQIFQPAQYISHFCCSFGSFLSIALNVEYTGKPMPTVQLQKQKHSGELHIHKFLY